MIVMPAGSGGWFFHCLARETGRLGHLYSPGHHRGPWPWFPYALDNLAFTCWDPADNTFDEEKWQRCEEEWLRLLFWASVAGHHDGASGFKLQPALWAIVPDRPGDWLETVIRYARYAPIVVASGIPLAVAVQDGATPESVRRLLPAPAVICVGGTTDWKWATVEMWAREFPRVHLLRCNSPTKLYDLERMGVESTDGTGWNRGDRTQTAGLEAWARGPLGRSIFGPLHPFVCRVARKTHATLTQSTFA